MHNRKEVPVRVVLSFVLLAVALLGTGCTSKPSTIGTFEPQGCGQASAFEADLQPGQYLKIKDTGIIGNDNNQLVLDGQRVEMLPERNVYEWGTFTVRDQGDPDGDGGKNIEIVKPCTATPTPIPMEIPTDQ